MGSTQSTNRFYTAILDWRLYAFFLYHFLMARAAGNLFDVYTFFLLGFIRSLELIRSQLET